MTCKDEDKVTAAHWDIDLRGDGGLQWRPALESVTTMSLVPSTATTSETPFESVPFGFLICKLTLPACATSVLVTGACRNWWNRTW